MKILVVFTGGTIGSSLKNGYISPDEPIKYELVENYRKSGDEDTQFDAIAPFTALSETLGAKRLNRLIMAINDNLHKDYDGIIVTHGTDTLQYSAVAAAYCLKTGLPIVFVGSNHPLDDERANGNDNFSAAIKFIKEGAKGVFIAYRNNDGRFFYHIPQEVLRHPERSDDILSADSPFATLIDGRVVFLKSKQDVDGCICPNGVFAEKPGVLTVFARPEDQFQYNLDRAKAVLIYPYHSGTLDVDNQHFKRFCYEAAKKKVPIFVADYLNADQYCTVSHYSELGIIALKSPFIPSFVKLWLGVSSGQDITEFMSK